MKFFVDDKGSYLGGWEESPPADALEVPTAPEDARQVWSFRANEWTSVPLTLQDYDAALMGIYDRAAQSMGYMNWQTCALRAHRPGPFEAEGTAFYDWMEACNVKGYQILADVTGGKRTQPTIEQFLSEMPPFVRPQ